MMNAIKLIQQFEKDEIINPGKAAALRRSARRAMQKEKRRNRGKKLNPLYNGKASK